MVKKRISFSENTKKHDGIDPKLQLFEDYIVKCIKDNKNLQQFLQDKTLFEIKSLKVLLTDLIKRCQSSNKNKIPLFPHGGGKGYAFRSEYFNFFWQHLQYLIQIIVNKQSQEE